MPRPLPRRSPRRTPASTSSTGCRWSHNQIKQYRLSSLSFHHTHAQRNAWNSWNSWNSWNESEWKPSTAAPSSLHFLTTATWSTRLGHVGEIISPSIEALYRDDQATMATSPTAPADFFCNRPCKSRSHFRIRCIIARHTRSMQRMQSMQRKNASNRPCQPAAY